jgi:bifunctional NMN adenylyltransferase/nudix hydrolase
MKDVCVYVGRFSPFHLGHAYVLEQALKSYKLVVVLVGSSDKARTPRNPFTFDERRDMIYSWAGMPDNLIVLPMRDFASNNMWIKSVQATVKGAIKNFCHPRRLILTDIYLTGSDRDDTTWYLNAFPQWKTDLLPPRQHNPGTANDLSATSVREVLYETPDRLIATNVLRLMNKLPLSTVKFLENFVTREDSPIWALRKEYEFVAKSKAAWAGAPYPVNFMAADAVIIQSGHVLVVKRGNYPGYGLWALPGGYVNVNERIRAAAVREAMEETGIRLTTGKRAEELTRIMLNSSIRDHEIFDDPKRSERGRMITVAYLMRLDDTKPLPAVAGQKIPFYEADGKDELETLEVIWLPLDRAFDNPTNWFEDHLQILQWGADQLDD